MRHPHEQNSRTETYIKTKIIDMLRREFPQVWFYKSADKYQHHIPDLILCCAGTFLGLEIKKPGLDADGGQQWCLNQINKAGGFARVVHSVDEVRQIVKETLWP